MSGGRLFAIAGLLAAAAGCGGSGAPPSPTTTTPGTRECVFTPAANPPLFDAVGGAASVAVATAPGCRYRIEPASPADAWAAPERDALLDGPASVRIVAEPNRSFTTRTATLAVRHVNGDVLATYSVAQRGAGCLYSVSPGTVTLGWMGTYDGSGDSPVTISVHAEPASCMWTAAGSVPWLKVYVGGSGPVAGDGRVFMSAITWNDSGQPMTGDFVIAGLSGVNPDARVHVTLRPR